MEVPQDIMLRYIERRKRDLEDCLGFIEKQNFNEIERVGHQLKGNGSTFGHPELSLIGVKLEEAAQAQNLIALDTALKDFSEWINSQN